MQRIASVLSRGADHVVGVPGAAALGVLLAVLAWQRAGLMPVESLEALPGWAALVPLRAPEVAELPPIHAAIFAVVAEPLPDSMAIERDSRCGDQQMGAVVSESRGRYAVQGPSDNPDPHLARPVPGRGFPTAHGAVTDGFIPLEHVSGSSGPTAPFGRDAALGTESTNEQGRMWGDMPAEDEGENGLGLSGLVGGVVKRFDVAPTADNTAGLRVVHTGLRVTGARKPSEVGRTMAAHFADFRACAESANGTNGANGGQGRVSLTFDVSEDGRVAAAGAGSGALEQCAYKILAGVVFAVGADSVAHVVYPLYFSAADREIASPHVTPSAPTKPCDCGG